VQPSSSLWKQVVDWKRDAKRSWGGLHYRVTDDVVLGNSSRESFHVRYDDLGGGTNTW
jgi:hypothetical protein